jgi:hypothetical protein
MFIKQGAYPLAVSELHQAFEGVPHLWYASALALAFQSERQFGRSYDLLSAIAELEPRPDDAQFEARRKWAIQNLELAAAEFGHVRIEVHPEEILDKGEVQAQSDPPLLLVDGSRVPPTVLTDSLRLEAGSHRLEAWARCHETREVNFMVSAGEERTIQVSLNRLRRGTGQYGKVRSRRQLARR